MSKISKDNSIDFDSACSLFCSLDTLGRGELQFALTCLTAAYRAVSGLSYIFFKLYQSERRFINTCVLYLTFTFENSLRVCFNLTIGFKNCLLNLSGSYFSHNSLAILFKMSFAENQNPAF